MRIATYNIEWFSALFDRDNKLLDDNGWSRRRNIKRHEQLDAIAHVIRTVDPDLLVIVEAPNSGHRQSTIRALTAFARAYDLRQTHAVMGFENETDQEIATLYDPSRVTPRHDPQGEPGNGDTLSPRFDSVFRLDVDVDGQPDLHRFSKPPMELSLQLPGRGTPIRLIGVHLKSKSPHGAVSEAEERVLAIANRRKQLAQAVWIRARVDAHLDAGEDVIVLGDFNDGPGLDNYETLFGHSSVEVVLGDPALPDRHLSEPHARIRLDARLGWSLSSARFYYKPQRRYVNALLDYIMVSADLVAAADPSWRIWHPFDDPVCFEDPALRNALLRASDHFPVSVDLNFPDQDG